MKYMAFLKPFKKAPFPDPPSSFLKILGPSFIILGLGLGSGEIILWPYLVSNFGFGWPGIIASSAKIFGHVLGVESFHILAIVFLIAIGLILTLGPVLYKTVETFQKTIILLGVPALILLTLAIASKSDYFALAKGSVGIGDGYLFLPQGISLLTFLAAFAFSGAGGNLNLSQSYYIREKGYGMGKYAQKIQSLLTGKTKEVELEGTEFIIDGHAID